MANHALPQEYAAFLTDRWQETAAAMTQLAGMMSTEKLLRSPDALPNGLGDMMRNSDKEKDILRHALQAGLGDRLFQQLNGQHTAQQFKADAAFLSEQTYMAQEACEQIVACFYCMLGWPLPVGGKPEPAPQRVTKPEPQPDVRPAPEVSPYQAPQPEIRPGEEISPYPQPKPEPQPQPTPTPNPGLMAQFQRHTSWRNMYLVLHWVAWIVIIPASSGVENINWILGAVLALMAVSFFGATNRQAARSEVGRKIEPNRTPEQQKNRNWMHAWNIFAFCGFTLTSVGLSGMLFSPDTVADDIVTKIALFATATVVFYLLGRSARSKDIGTLK